MAHTRPRRGPARTLTEEQIRREREIDERLLDVLEGQLECLSDAEIAERMRRTDALMHALGYRPRRRCL